MEREILFDYRGWGCGIIVTWSPPFFLAVKPFANEQGGQRSLVYDGLPVYAVCFLKSVVRSAIAEIKAEIDEMVDPGWCSGVGLNKISEEVEEEIEACSNLQFISSILPDDADMDPIVVERRRSRVLSSRSDINELT